MRRVAVIAAGAAAVTVAAGVALVFVVGRFLLPSTDDLGPHPMDAASAARAMQLRRIVIPDGFTFEAAPRKLERTYGWAPGFAWWPMGNPAAASFSVADFRTAATSAQGIKAEALAGLTWSGSSWRASTAAFAKRSTLVGEFHGAAIVSKPSRLKISRLRYFATGAGA